MRSSPSQAPQGSICVVDITLLLFVVGTLASSHVDVSLCPKACSALSGRDTSSPHFESTMAMFEASTESKHESRMLHEKCRVLGKDLIHLPMCRR